MKNNPSSVTVEQVDREAAAAYVENGIGMRDVAARILNGEHDLHATVQAFARHRLAASPAVREDVEAKNGLLGQTGAPGRVVIGADDPLYKAFRPKPETIAAIEKNEQANAAGLAVIRDMMFGHVTNWPEPKKFGTAISLIDKAFHAALTAKPSQDEAAATAKRDEGVREDVQTIAEREARQVCADYRLNPQIYEKQGGKHPLQPYIEDGIKRALATLSPANGDAMRVAIEALEPFAKAAEPIIHDSRDLWRPDEWTKRHNLITVGDYRRAHAALTTLTKGSTDVG